MSNKELVKKFIDAVNTNDVDTLREIVTEDYIQHNPNVPTGREPFLGLLPVLQEHKTQAVTARMIAEGNYVVMHNIWQNAAPFGAPEMVAFDVIRINENGLIAEHWDAMMVQTPANPSGHTLTDGRTEVKEQDKTTENKAKIIEMFDVLINGAPEDMGAALPNYFHTDYIQHNPDAADGIAGFAEAIQSGKLNFTFDKQHHVIAEGNFVLSVSEGTHRGNPAVFYDLLRMEDGKVAEHWDVIQDIPAESVHGNSMFDFK